MEKVRKVKKGTAHLRVCISGEVRVVTRENRRVGSLSQGGGLHSELRSASVHELLALVNMKWLCRGIRLMNQVLLPFLEKAMAPHSSTLAWKIPWMEEPGRLQSMGSLRVRYDWATSLWLFTFMHRSRKWQPTPVFLSGESQGRGSLVGCRLWGRTESDTTEVT